MIDSKYFRKIGSPYPSACFLTLALILWINPVKATDLPQNTPSKCSFGAFVQETDAKGLNVRQHPTLQSKILGTLPPSFKSKSLDGFTVKITVDVLESKNGWFLITNAQDNSDLTGVAERPVFRGAGWVSGQKLTLKSQSSIGYGKPDENSPPVIQLKDNIGFDTEGDDAFMDNMHLIDCQGDWAFIELKTKTLSPSLKENMGLAPTSENIRAWVRGICGIQETSCSVSFP